MLGKWREIRERHYPHVSRKLALGGTNVSTPPPPTSLVSPGQLCYVISRATLQVNVTWASVTLHPLSHAAGADHRISGIREGDFGESSCVNKASFSGACLQMNNATGPLVQDPHIHSFFTVDDPEQI